MNTYKIQIKGMHCSGCKSLITMSLEDEGLQDITVDDKTGAAEFTSASYSNELITVLDKVFAELKDYSYSNLERLEK